MRNIRFAALAALAAFGLSGCATVINGTSQDYKIKTDPSGAKVTFNDGASCESPCKLSLKRRKDARADITRDGYKPTYVLVQSQLGGAVAGNILLGGIVGGVVDSANGSTNHLYPSPLSVKLAPVDSSEEAALLDKKGKVIATVQAHNDKVRKDVTKTLGAEKAGTVDPAKAAAAIEPVAAPAPAADPAPVATPAPTVTPAPATTATP